ncbi:MAG TPA: CDP-alcohol phosphatidyltransferase family protein [Acidimicrobiia bacterium]|nr:CDP-alcohol phosphatidyltransferase family protein [Acidimicrobiia bacterium]
MGPSPLRPSRGILTIPNFVTLVRLGCLPLFCWLLFARDDRTAAAWLLAVLGCTDWVDGYLARHLNQVSELGKILDPTADRLLFGTVVISLLIDGHVPWIVGWAVLVREVLISGAVLALAAAGARRIDVQWAGKAGTLALMVAFPLFMMGTPGPWGRPSLVIAWLFAAPGLVLAWYAAATYVPMARRALAEGRAARTP